MAWVLLLVQLGMTGVMLVAATGKLLRADEFVGALRLSRLPHRLVPALAVAVPVAEAALAFALALASPRALPALFLASALLLGAFTLWMVSVDARRLYVRCGCFGPAGGEVGARSIGRNLLLMAVAMAGLLLSSRVDTPLPGPSLPTVMTAVNLAMAAALVQALVVRWPNLALTRAKYEAQTASSWNGE